VVSVAFGGRLAGSEQFDRLFKEGMALVDRTAAYLDGTGRKEARGLRPPVNVIYATESMRLTTRLLELASWLLIRRAVNEGEITAAEAAAKRARVKLRPHGRPAHIAHYCELPEGLRALIEESFALNDRVQRLDRMISPPVPAAEADPADNPVAAQQARIIAAFGPRTRSAGR
jgi:regulator of CtrA degradation